MTNRDVARMAIMDALGLPGVILVASFVGFGSLVHQSGVDFWAGLASTIGIWALPGQVVLVELTSVGASLVSVTLAVFLTNARLLPMVVTLLPLMRRPGKPAWMAWAQAHVIAATTWANAQRRFPTLSPAQRDVWFNTFGGFVFTLTILATVVGHALSGMVPRSVSLGLVFLNPLYFLLLFAADARSRARVLALAFGAVLGPLAHLWVPGYGLLVAGVTGGSLAFLIDELARRRGGVNG